MVVRYFQHTYSPAGSGTSSPNPLPLSTAEIADAAIREVIQMSLSASPFDLLLEQLLDPSDQWFRWLAQLGQVRETKTALSGLFGRFVARAYLTRYFKHAYFEPIRSSTQTLAGWPNLTVHRTKPGDLPDWITATAVGSPVVAVAEAKGSHNTAGAGPPLAAAKEQATRVEIRSAGTSLRIKRFAIATRWAVQGNANLALPWLCVDDPADGEREPTEEELRSLRRSVSLGHFSAMAEGLGLKRAANALGEAKLARPGSLQIPDQDIVEVDTYDGTQRLLAAVVARSGVIQIPREITGDYVSALRTVFQDQAMLIGVDVDYLARLDANEQFVATPPATEREPVEPSAFWTRRRSEIDGSELLPLLDMQVRRPAGV